MARAWLDGQQGPGPTRVLLDGDVPVETQAAIAFGDYAVDLGAVYPEGEIRAHGRTGYDSEGSPVYGWSTIVAGPLVALHVSTSASGEVESGTATILTEFAEAIPDDAVLVVDGTERFTITRIDRTADRAELAVTRGR